MPISYDAEIDALYIRLIEGPQECRTVRLNDEIALNIGTGETLVGVEVLDAKQVLGPGEARSVGVHLRWRDRIPAAEDAPLAGAGRRKAWRVGGRNASTWGDSISIRQPLLRHMILAGESWRTIRTETAHERHNADAISRFSMKQLEF